MITVTFALKHQEGKKVLVFNEVSTHYKHLECDDFYFLPFDIFWRQRVLRTPAFVRFQQEHVSPLQRLTLLEQEQVLSQTLEWLLSKRYFLHDKQLLHRYTLELQYVRDLLS